jgi:hypothetical protein
MHDRHPSPQPNVKISVVGAGICLRSAIGAAICVRRQ